MSEFANCPECGRIFMPGNREQIYCSRKCVNESIRKGRTGSAYIRWKRGVVERAGGVCEMCKSTDGRKVFAHHIIPLSESPELKTVPANGMCVCDTCHNVIHDQVGNTTLIGERGLYGARHRMGKAKKRKSEVDDGERGEGGQR